MGYCFMSTGKIKTLGGLNSKCNHNERKVDVENADPDYADQNEELVPLPKKEDGTDMNYAEAFKNRVYKLPYYHTHDVRSNAVLGIEVVTTFSREEDIDIESWKTKNVEWLKNTFDVAPDGKSNVVHVVFHGDEVGNVHCHALVIPIDEKGKLNASRFLDGVKALRDLQTSYANDMEEFGLERGLQGSSAKHQDIRKFYAELNKSLEVSQQRDDENFLEYQQRVIDDMQTNQAAMLRIRKEYEQRERRKTDEYKIKARQEIKKEYEDFEKKTNGMASKWNRSIEEIDECIRFTDNFREKAQLLQEQAPDKARMIAKVLTYMNSLEKEEDLERDL